MRKRVKEIQCCRISGSKNLVSVLNLGVQKLTGVFPSTTTEELTEGPLELVWCPESGLVQMKHSYDLEEMYGMNYGYRSGLNKSMVDMIRRIDFAALPSPRRGKDRLDQIASRTDPHPSPVGPGPAIGSHAGQFPKKGKLPQGSSTVMAFSFFHPFHHAFLSTPPKMASYSFEGKAGYRAHSSGVLFFSRMLIRESGYPRKFPHFWASST